MNCTIYTRNLILVYIHVSCECTYLRWLRCVVVVYKWSGTVPHDLSLLRPPIWTEGPIHVHGTNSTQVCTLLTSLNVQHIGCQHIVMGVSQRTCVVFPQPVSPLSTTTWFSSTNCSISACLIHDGNFLRNSYTHTCTCTYFIHCTCTFTM